VSHWKNEKKKKQLNQLKNKLVDGKNKKDIRHCLCVCVSRIVDQKWSSKKHFVRLFFQKKKNKFKK
jgi:hypothetical protein